MNLLHLKYAVEIAKVGSLNRAAENLYMGQPNLSRAIKDLEGSLGISIFERSPKGMVPTPDGEEFLQYANKILHEVDELENVFKFDTARKQIFSISVPRASYISDAFAAFSTSIGSDMTAELFYKETNSHRAIKNILESDYRLGIIRYAATHDRYFKEMLDEKGMSYEMITEFSYRLLMSKDHPLATSEDIKISDLTDYIEIAHADPFVPSIPISVVKKEELACNTRRQIFVFERASQFDLLAKNHETFMWVSPIPTDTLQRYGLVEKIVSENKKIYKDVLIHRNDYKLSRLDNLFITELCNSKRKYLGGQG